MKLARRADRRDDGATLVEYAIMIALIAAVAVAAVALLGGTVDGLFGDPAFASF